MSIEEACERFTEACYAFWRVLTDPVPEPPGLHWHNAISEIQSYGVDPFDMQEALMLIRSSRRVKVMQLKKQFGETHATNLMNVLELLGLIQRTSGRWTANPVRVERCLKRWRRSCHRWPRGESYELYGVSRFEILEALTLIQSQRRVCVRLLKKRFGLVRGADVLSLLEALRLIYQYTPPEWEVNFPAVDRHLKARCRGRGESFGPDAV